MSTIYLFRHGQSEFNLKKIFTGWLDAKLTPLGIEQAKTLGKLLKNKQIDLAYSSSLSRALDTLHEVLVFHPNCQEILIDDRIIERSYGDLAGHSHEEVIKKYGQEQFDRLAIDQNLFLHPDGRLVTRSEMPPECFKNQNYNRMPKIRNHRKRR